MLYKTIVLELIQDRPALHRFLKASKTLLPTLNSLAGELKASHEEWMEQIRESKPDSDSQQVESEALEIALKILEERLPSAPDEDGEFSLDGAMAFLRRHTPTA